MTIGERGQVTIPKELRERFGLQPKSRVEFHVVEGALVLRKAEGRANFAKWKGRCADQLRKLGLSSGDELLAEVRGRE